MHTLTIDLGARSYPILIGRDLLSADYLLPNVTHQIMVVTNETIAPMYLEKTLAALRERNAQHVILPDGEQYKSTDTLNQVYEALLTERFDRGCTVLALGGGVIGDMTGYVAASYQRGVNFVQVPTTLLAQVDSSVGGKTAVNHPLGKNMIGAFHQPKAVLADMSVLDTLSDREFKAGLAEVIKYGFILDATFFEWLENNMESLLARDSEAVAWAVRRSCEIKAQIVSNDELEHGQRALLNFGHTFGHAIEAAMGYGNWLHGEAISAGMVLALDMSVRTGRIGGNSMQRGVHLLDSAGLPIAPPTSMTPESMLSYMARDKKVSDGQLKLILSNAIGETEVTTNFSADDLNATLNKFLA